MKKGKPVAKNDFSILLTSSFAKNIKKKYGNNLLNNIQEKLFPVLQNEPKFGPKIKRLHGNLGLIYRYHTGGLKIFYFIDEDEKKVYLLDAIKNESL